MYSKATRLKLRWSYNGTLTVEDLWDLQLKQLNQLAKSLNTKLKESKEEDFLNDFNTEDEITKLKFNIVIDILNIKKKESKDAQDALDIKKHNQQILSLIAEKQNEELRGKSIDELKAMIQ